MAGGALARSHMENTKKGRQQPTSLLKLKKCHSSALQQLLQICFYNYLQKGQVWAEEGRGILTLTYTGLWTRGGAMEI